jgi:hypothetical protein
MGPSQPSRTKFLFVEGHSVGGSELAVFSFCYTLAFTEMSEAIPSISLHVSRSIDHSPFSSATEDSLKVQVGVEVVSFSVLLKISVLIIF